MRTEKQESSQKLIFPSQEQIKNKIKEIEEILSNKYLNMVKNFGLKEGLNDCVRILKDRLKNPNNQYFIPVNQEEYEKANEIYKKQLSGISDLETSQGRAIAIICVDYLNGRCDEGFIERIEKMIKKR